jgi:hypothetical protein
MVANVRTGSASPVPPGSPASDIHPPDRRSPARPEHHGLPGAPGEGPPRPRDRGTGASMHADSGSPRPRAALLRPSPRDQGGVHAGPRDADPGPGLGDASAHHGGHADKTPRRDPDSAKSARHTPHEPAFTQQRGGDVGRGQGGAPSSGARGAGTQTGLPPALAPLFQGPPIAPPSPAQWQGLQQALDTLRAEFHACGVPGGFDALAAVLARTAPLSRLAEQPAQELREAGAALLQCWAERLSAATAPGRDGAELAGLYGHHPELDRAIDALRVTAAARMLLDHPAPQQGLPEGQPDARTLIPTQAHQEARAAAAALVKRERGIAEAKLEILRLLAPQAGFMPALDGLRITPALAEGLGRAEPAVARRAGVLMGALLADEHELAASAEGRRMRQAVQARLQALPGASGPEHAYLERRAAALQPQPAAGGLSAAEVAQLRLQGADPAVLPALLRELAARGLAGTGEVEQLLAGTGRAAGRIRQDRERLDRLDAAYQRALDIERGRVLAGAMLAALGGLAAETASPGGLSASVDPGGPSAGLSALCADTSPATNERLRSALTGPGGPLAAFGLQATAQPALQGLAARYRESLHAQQCVEGEQLVQQLDTMHSRLAGDARRPLAGIDAAAGEAQATEAARRRGMQAVLAERRQAMGPERAQALEQVLRAAALLAQPEAWRAADADGGWLQRIATAPRHLGEDLWAGLLGEDPVQLHRAGTERLLQAWGLDVAAIAPELHDLLSRPIDTACLDQWFAAFEPAPGLRPAWAGDLAALAGRLQPGGAPRLASASLGRFMQGLDRLEPGTRLDWHLDSRAGLSTGLVPLPVAPPAGVAVQLGGSAGTACQVQASCDAQGYQLVLRAGRSAQGELRLAATIGALWSGVLGVQALAGIEGRGQRLDGVALRFPGTDAGRRDMKQLLQRVLERGHLDLQDLADAAQVLPAAARSGGVEAHAGVRLDLELPVAALSANGVDTLNLAPRLDVKVLAGTQESQHAAVNRREQVHEHERSFTLRLVAEATPRLGATVHPASGPGQPPAGEGMALHLPLPGASPRLAEFQCSETRREVLEAGRVSGTTERSVRIAGPAALLGRAADAAGGAQLRAVVAYLHASPRPEHQGQGQALAALLHSAAAGDGMRIVWRIAPQVQAAASRLLQQARAVSAGQAGHAGMREAHEQAARLEAQARALLADPAGYRLHAVERLACEASSEKLGGLLDLGHVNLAYVQWGATLQGSHERRTASIVFDPGVVEDALRDAGAGLQPQEGASS